MEITRELNKESSMYYYPIYTNSTWSVLSINNPTLKYIYCYDLKSLEWDSKMKSLYWSLT